MERKRDILARDRTQLANERTLLAYMRTTLTFLVLGGFLIKFLSSKYCIILAWLSILFGMILFLYGVRRYFSYKERINER